MSMASFARGAEPTEKIYAILETDTPAHRNVEREFKSWSKLSNTVLGFLKRAREEMGLPEFQEFFPEAKNGKIVNISMSVRGLGMSVNELRAKFPVVEGRGNRSGFFRLRDKSPAQKQFAALMADSPVGHNLRDVLPRAFGLSERGELDVILGYPGTEKLDDGRYLLSLREGWPTWIEAVQAAGGRILTKPEALRILADNEEAKQTAKSGS